MVAVRQGVGRAIKVSGGGSFSSVRRVAYLRLFAAAAVTALGGCSTVLKSENSAELRAAAIEREALKSAAEAVASVKWPKPESADWGARLAGVVGAAPERVSEDDAARAYLAVLGPAPRKDALLADAARHVAAAGELARLAEGAAEAIRPTMTDVSIVEEAIIDFRRTRDVYYEAVAALAGEGEAFSSAESRALKASFSDAIERLGDAADALADRVAEDDTRTFAGPTSASKFVN
jgi:hypothetical protein